MVRLTVQVLDSRFVTRLVQLAAVASLILATVLAIKQYQFTGCLASYNEAFAKSSAARAAATEADRKAEDDMWQAFADAGNPQKVPPAEARKYAADAFQRYLKQRQQAREDRARNPLPAPPSQRC